MKVKICIRDIDIKSIFLAMLTIGYFIGGVYAYEVVCFAVLFFMAGVFFTATAFSTFVLRNSDDVSYDTLIDKEFEITNPIALIKKRLMKFKVGDIVDKIHTDWDNRKRGKITGYNSYFNTFGVEWKDGDRGGYKKRELKLSKIENWKERIK